MWEPKAPAKKALRSCRDRPSITRTKKYNDECIPQRKNNDWEFLCLRYLKRTQCRVCLRCFEKTRRVSLRCNAASCSVHEELIEYPRFYQDEKSEIPYLSHFFCSYQTLSIHTINQHFIDLHVHIFILSVFFTISFIIISKLFTFCCVWGQNYNGKTSFKTM